MGRRLAPLAAVLLLAGCSQQPAEQPTVETKGAPESGQANAIGAGASQTGMAPGSAPGTGTAPPPPALKGDELQVNPNFKGR